MDYVTYSDLRSTHGENAAKNLLCLLEELAEIKDAPLDHDMDLRFEKALKALSTINFAA